MIQTATSIEDLTLNIVQEVQVNASLDLTFEALLEQVGPANNTPDGRAMPMKLEAWPGGRWYRDLGDDNGHFWGQRGTFCQQRPDERKSQSLVDSAVIILARFSGVSRS